jgi:drug/metabolite transporter (DMT)-like permease
MTTLTPVRNPLAANLICSLSMLIWAAGLPAADMLIGLVPPLPLTAARVALAAAFLLPLWLVLDGWGEMRRAHWGKGVLVGGTIALGAFMLVLAQGMTDAVTVAVISASMPVVGIALEVLLDGRRMTLGLILGLILSLLGGVLALAGKIGGIGLGVGAGLAFASVVAFTLGSRWTVTAFPGLTPMGRTAITLTGAALVALLLTAGFAVGGAAGPEWAALGWPHLAALAVFGIGGLAISQVLWIMSVGSLGIGLASLHINLAPFYVMFILFGMGGAWDWLQALGAVIVGIGVLVAQGVFLLPERFR